jgi:hypothetical protein
MAATAAAAATTPSMGCLPLKLDVLDNPTPSVSPGTGRVGPSPLLRKAHAVSSLKLSEPDEEEEEEGKTCGRLELSKMTGIHPLSSDTYKWLRVSVSPSVCTQKVASALTPHTSANKEGNIQLARGPAPREV